MNDFLIFLFGDLNSNYLLCVDPVLGGAIVAGVASVGSSVFNWVTGNAKNKWMLNKQNEYNLHGMEVQQEYNKELMALQQQYALENWNRENDYNLPIHQRERLLDAGINPNFADAVNSGLAGQVQSISQPSAPQAMVPDVAQIANAGTAQAEQLSQGVKSAAETALTVAQTKGQKISNDIMSTTAKYTDSLMSGSVELQNVQIQLAGAKTQESYEQCYQLMAAARNLDKSTELLNENIPLVRKQVELYDQQKTNAEAELDLIIQQERTEEARENLFNNQASEAYESSETARQLRPLQKDYTESMTALNNSNISLNEVQQIYTKALTNVAHCEALLKQAQTIREKAEAKKALAEAHESRIRALYHPQMINSICRANNAKAGLDEAQSLVANNMAALLISQTQYQDMFNQSMKHQVSIPVKTQKGIEYCQFDLITAKGVMSLQLDEANAWKSYQEGNYAEKGVSWFDFNQAVNNATSIVDSVNGTISAFGSLLHGAGSAGLIK